MNRNYISLLFGWALLGLLFGTIYGAAHMVLRQSANNTPTQLAEQARIDLANGKSIGDILPQTTNELVNSFAATPFIITYDSSYNMIASTITVNGQKPEVPIGVLTAATQPEGQLANENRVTWEPVVGTREAIVVVATPSGLNSKVAYVVAGQSLRLIEQQAKDLVIMVAIGWILSSLLWLGYWLLAVRK